MARIKIKSETKEVLIFNTSNSLHDPRITSRQLDQWNILQSRYDGMQERLRELNERSNKDV